MKLNLEQVGYRNFLSSGNTFTVIDTNHHKTTLFCGNKGSGKTTFNDAICFTWFNKALRKINKNLLINTINSGATETFTVFTIGSNRYKILRGIKPNKLEIFVNDEELTLPAGKEPQDWIEELLGFSYKTLKHVVLLGNASFVPFMQMDAKERRELVEDLRGLHVFSEMGKLAKIELDGLSKKIGVVDSEIKVLTNKISMLEDFIKETSASSESQKEPIKKDIEAQEQIIASKRDMRASLISDGKTLNGTFLGDPDAIKKELDDLQAQRQEANAKKLRLEKNIDEFSAIDDCPTCKQKVDPEHKHSIQERVDNQILKLSGGLALIDKDIESVLDKHNQNESIKSKLDELRTEIKSIDVDVANALKVIEKRNSMLEEIDKQFSSIDDRKKELDLAIASLNDKQQNYDFYSTQISNLTESQKHLKDDGIKASLIDEFIPVFNALVNKYLDKMDFFVRFELDKEFNEVIKSRHRDSFSYYSFSEGEKTTIDIAIMLAWRELSMMSGNALTNFIVLDEVIDSSLDNNGTQLVLDILQEISNGVNIIVISHKPKELFDCFERTIEFTKIKNFSVANVL